MGFGFIDWTYEDVQRHSVKIKDLIGQRGVMYMYDEFMKNFDNLVDKINEDIIILRAFNLAPSIQHISEIEFKGVQKAISNLLSDYKRVLKENESLQKTYDDCYCKYKHYKQFESISVQKVKDKIEKLEKIQKEFPNNERLEVKIIAYKELLGKE